jgi:hypothetical protein
MTASLRRSVLMAGLLITAGLIACRSTIGGPAPRFFVTAAPLDVVIGSRGLCIAVNPSDATGVWWWEPGRSGCSSRSTGPGVFHADDATVATDERATPIDVRFRLKLIDRPGEERFLDIRLALRDADIRCVSTGMQVPIERRHDLEIPEQP